MPLYCRWKSPGWKYGRITVSGWWLSLSLGRVPGVTSLEELRTRKVSHRTLSLRYNCDYQVTCWWVFFLFSFCKQLRSNLQQIWQDKPKAPLQSLSSGVPLFYQIFGEFSEVTRFITKKRQVPFIQACWKTSQLTSLLLTLSLPTYTSLLSIIFG